MASRWCRLFIVAGGIPNGQRHVTPTDLGELGNSMRMMTWDCQVRDPARIYMQEDNLPLLLLHIDTTPNPRQDNRIGLEGPVA